MELYSLSLIFRWMVPLWLTGWLLLPASKQVFPNLADGGLAAGRFLSLVLASLLAFWVASLHIIPLPYSCWAVAALPCLSFVVCFSHKNRREEFLNWIKINKKSLLVSDLVFLLSFLFFVYLRLCQPEIRDQEKPMDSAIIGVLSRTLYLPADNPWFSGIPFTNYYYFGHFMAAVLKRAFFTPLPYAYNLIQPIFCAFFISILWSLCAAITKSLRVGLLATALIALCGNYEPLRQSFIAWQSNKPLWPLDWWSTSRVVSNTINEYPFFSLALGDAHAHFFSFSLGALFLCVCHELSSHTSQDIRAKKYSFVLSGVILGAIVMTNAWDTPLYFLIGMFSLFAAIKQGAKFQTLGKPIPAAGLFASLLLLTLTTALPFLWHFKSPVSGIRLEFWIPSFSFFLHWGSFICAVGFIFLYNSRFGCKNSSIHPFTFIVLIAGLIGLILPLLFYIQGHFGGELRHQDTVFKFWLQAWLLLGIPIFCSVASKLNCFSAVNPITQKPMFLRVQALKALYILLLTIPAICTWSVIAARSQKTANQLDLNGARFLSQSDQQMIRWLEASPPGTTIIEAVGENPDGSFIGAYTKFGRVSFLTGIPTKLGWPQHAGFWGADQQAIQQRYQEIRNFYISYSDTNPLNRQSQFPRNNSTQNSLQPETELLNAARENRPFIIWGDLESSLYGIPQNKLRLLNSFKDLTPSGKIPPEPPAFIFIMPPA